MPFEIGQRVTFRSLQREVEDSSSDGVLALFDRDRAKQGHRVRVVLELGEPLECTEIPEPRWNVGDPNWDRWSRELAVHDRLRQAAWRVVRVPASRLTSPEGERTARRVAAIS